MEELIMEDKSYDVDVAEFSLFLKKEYWEKTKNDPKLLSAALTMSINMAASTDWLRNPKKNMRAVLDRFEITEKELHYRFNFYNLDSKEQEEVYKSKLSAEDRKEYEDWNRVRDEND
jgi:hypothetical protein